MLCVIGLMLNIGGESGRRCGTSSREPFFKSLGGIHSPHEWAGFWRASGFCWLRRFRELIWGGPIVLIGQSLDRSKSGNTPLGLRDANRRGPRVSPCVVRVQDPRPRAQHYRRTQNRASSPTGGKVADR